MGDEGGRSQMVHRPASRAERQTLRENFVDRSTEAPKRGTFSIVSLIKEDAALVKTFVRYYLSEGADSMTIYFDGPSTVPKEALPANVELIEVGPKDKMAIPTGDAGHRSAFQGVLHLKEHARTKADWMLAVDADEYVTTGTGMRLDAFFAALPADLEAVRFPVAEAVWTGGEDTTRPFTNTWFRAPLGRWQTALLTPFLYGRRTRLYRRGLIGHCAGKSAVRTSVPVDKIGCHHGERGGRVLGRWAGEDGIAPALVAHFDAISFIRWTEKFGHRIEGRISMRGIGKSRARQVHAAARAIADGRPQPLFRAMYGLNAFQLVVLRALGKARRLSVVERLQETFRDVEADQLQAAAPNPRG